MPFLNSDGSNSTEEIITFTGELPKEAYEVALATYDRFKSTGENPHVHTLEEFFGMAVLDKTREFYEEMMDIRDLTVRHRPKEDIPCGQRIKCTDDGEKCLEVVVLSLPHCLMEDIRDMVGFNERYGNRKSVDGILETLIYFAWEAGSRGELKSPKWLEKKDKPGRRR
jgi:hypothetical protein